MGLPLSVHAALAATTAALATSLLLGWGRRRAARLAVRGAPPTVANRAPPSLDAPATIAFLGDVQKGVRDVAGPVAEAIRREGVRFLVSSGDLASHGEAPYHGIVGEAFARAGLDVPFLVAPGNHDLQPSGVRDPAPGRRLFEALYGPRLWIARVGPLLVVGGDNGGAWLEDRQLDAIDAALAAEPAARWLLVLHRPPRRIDLDGSPPDRGCERLLATIARRPPEAVVSGHLARDAEAVVDGVRYVVNAEGGDSSGDSLRGLPPFRLLLADVAADGRVSLRRVELARRRDAAVACDQLAVRLWSDSRRAFLRPFAWLGERLLGGSRGG